ncbi:MAG: nucleotidyl transferase, partial [Chthoniobacterales bacterium]
FLSCEKKGLMTVFKNEGKWCRSNVIYENGAIIKYDNGRAAATMRHIDYGLLFFKKEAFAKIPDGQTSELTDLCSNLVNENQMAGYEAKKRFYEIGSFTGLEETRRYLEDRRTA